MPLPTYDTQDEIPEPFRELYEEKDGKFAPKAFEFAEDVAGLKTTLADQKVKARKAAEKAKALEDRLEALERERKAGDAGLPGDKLKEIEASFEKKYAPDIEERNRLREENRALKLDGKVKAWLAKAGAVDVEDAWAVVGREFDLTDDGKVILKHDPAADAEKYATADLVSKKGHLFKGTQASGGGAGGQPGKGQEGKPSKPVTQWTADERQAYKEQNGEDSFQKLLNEHLRQAAGVKAAA